LPARQTRRRGIAAFGLVPPAVAVGGERSSSRSPGRRFRATHGRPCAFHLRLPDHAVELVGDALEDADEKSPSSLVRAAGCLSSEMTSRARSSVSTTRVGLAGLVRQSFRPHLRPSHRLAGQIGDGVEEDDALAGDHLDKIGIGFVQMLIMGLREKARPDRPPG